MGKHIRRRVSPNVTEWGKIGGNEDIEKSLDNGTSGGNNIWSWSHD